jgi:hypothetical protein
MMIKEGLFIWIFDMAIHNAWLLWVKFANYKPEIIVQYNATKGALSVTDKMIFV